MKKLLLFLTLIVLTVSCSDDTMTPQEDAENIINQTVILPPGSYTLDEDAEVDESVEIATTSNGVMGVYEGNKMKVNIPFSSENGNVVGAGMRFGKNGKIHVIPISEAKGKNSGTLSFDFQIPPEICEDLSRICHDIKCYEFAVTDIGNISKENINDLALMCGNCNEPSCSDLVDCDYNYKVWWSFEGNSYEAKTNFSGNTGSEAAINLGSFGDTETISISAKDQSNNSLLIDIQNVGAIIKDKVYNISGTESISMGYVFSDSYNYQTYSGNNGELTITSLTKVQGSGSELVTQADGQFHFEAKDENKISVKVTGGFLINIPE